MVLVLSPIYFSISQISGRLTKYCVDRLLDENCRIINRVISNNKYYLLWHLRTRSLDTNYNDKRELINELNIYTQDNILKQYERLERCEKNTKEYNELLNKIIAVGEQEITPVK